MDGASYLNPYPIMQPHFCETVGRANGTGPVNCSLIDYDALLLGGCWCHACLPENPCKNGATCRNYQNQGYTCDCKAGYSGDHCQIGAHATDPFPWYVMPREAMGPHPPTPWDPILTPRLMMTWHRAL